MMPLQNVFQSSAAGVAGSAAASQAAPRL